MISTLSAGAGCEGRQIRSLDLIEMVVAAGIEPAILRLRVMRLRAYSPLESTGCSQPNSSCTPRVCGIGVTGRIVRALPGARWFIRLAALTIAAQGGKADTGIEDGLKQIDDLGRTGALD